MTKVVGTYAEFLDALEDGYKELDATEELYSWLLANLREAQTENVKGAPVSMSLYGITVRKVKG